MPTQPHPPLFALGNLSFRKGPIIFASFGPSPSSENIFAPPLLRDRARRWQGRQVTDDISSPSSSGLARKFFGLLLLLLPCFFLRGRARRYYSLSVLVRRRIKLGPPTSCSRHIYKVSIAPFPLAIASRPCISPGPCVQSLDEGIAEPEEQGGRRIYACTNEEYGSKIISCARPGADGRSPLKQGRYSHFLPPLWSWTPGDGRALEAKPATEGKVTKEREGRMVVLAH